MSQSEFIAKTIKEALDQAKEALGDDAYILESEETKQGIRIIATNDQPVLPKQPIRPSQELHSVTAKMLQDPKNNDFSFSKPVDAIKKIVEICEKHELGFSFCEKWLEQLSPDLKKDYFFLEDSLSNLIHFDPQWIHHAVPENPIILVGPPGCGKTSTIGKLALIFKSLNKNIQVVSLDEQKAGALEQLSVYMAPLQMDVKFGYQSYLKEKERAVRDQCLLLVDTPGVNILSQEGQEYFYKLSEKLQSPLTFVLPNDMRPSTAFEVAQEFAMYNTQYMIGTRFDVVQQYGAFFSVAFKQKMKPVLFSNSPKITQSLQILCAKKALTLLSV